MAAAKGVGAGQSDNLLVVEAHAVEDVAQMVVALAGVGETAIRRAEGDVTILATGAVGDDGALHFLDGADTTKDPQIGVGDPRVLSLYGLEEIAGSEKTGVGAVITLRGEAHSGAVAATGASLLIVGAACVPSEAEEDGAEAAIVVVVLLLEALGDLVVHALVVLLGRVDNLGRGGRGSTGGGVVPVAEATSGGGSSSKQSAGARRLLRVLGGVEASPLLAEGLARSSGEGVPGGGPGSHAGEGASS